MRYVIGAYIGAVAALVLFAAIAATVVVDSSASSDPIDEVSDRHSFDLLSWELHHFPEKWLYKAGDAIRGNGKGQSDEDVLERYFNLTNEIRALVSDDSDSSEIAPKEDERAFLENTVEDIIEGRMTSILEGEDLTLNAPLFSDIGTVWPPVDFEFDAPPRVLVVSPRDRITLERDDLLTPGLVDSTVENIEEEAEASDDRISALVVQAGGVSTYPSVVSDLRSYDGLIDVVSHEWTHSYLSFYPLGFGYFDSPDIRTLNETVADVAGRELAKLYFERYGHLKLHPTPSPSPDLPPSPGPTPAAFDFTEEMRDLRRLVEALLANGEIEEAEALMDARREDFEAKGVYIRKLNQAYFAFYGFYAGGAASIDPIGAKIDELYAESGSPGEFLRRARGITTRQDLDDVLAEASG